jgi:O-6-methylguanine DNA methyltransferase
MHDDWRTTTLHSPLGPLHAVASRWGLCALTFVDGQEEATVDRLRRQPSGTDAPPPNDPLDAASAWLSAYFRARPDQALQLPHVPLDLRGTPWEVAVWRQLGALPFGATTSYQQIAANLGRGAARAVGAAVGANPIAIVVPCHRVIGKDGSLTGYASGIPRKAWLLRHESVLLL